MATHIVLTYNYKHRAYHQPASNPLRMRHGPILTPVLAILNGASLARTSRYPYTRIRAKYKHFTTESNLSVDTHLEETVTDEYTIIGTLRGMRRRHAIFQDPSHYHGGKVAAGRD